MWTVENPTFIANVGKKTVWSFSNQILIIKFYSHKDWIN
jgi:hypothetical protein